MADASLNHLMESQPLTPVGRLVGSGSSLEGRKRREATIGYLGVAITAVTFVAAALRLFGLTNKSIWYDEAFVVTLAQMPIPDMIISLVALDPHPPLYYLFMHFWTLLGTDPIIVRLPSVIFSTLSVPLIYSIGSGVASPRVGLGAAAILAFSPFHIAWSQEARMYALLGFICLGSSYFLIRALQEGRNRDWAIVSALTAAALYTQYNAVFYMAAQNLAVLFVMLRSPELRKKSVIAWLASGAAAGAAFSFWLPAFMQQNETYRGLSLTFSSPRGVEALLFQFGYDNLPYWRITASRAVELRDALVATSLFLSFLGMWSLHRRHSGILLAFLFLGTVSLLTLVGMFRSILIPKTVISASFPFYILIAAGLAAFNRRTVLVVGVAGLLLLSSVGLIRYYTTGSTEEWQQATSYLEKSVRPGEPVLIDASAGLMPLNYYLSRSHADLETHGVPFKSWAVLPPPLSEEDFRQVDRITSGRQVVWLVIYRNGFPDPNGQLLPYLESRFQVTESRSLTKIDIFRFVGQSQ